MDDFEYMVAFAVKPKDSSVWLTDKTMYLPIKYRKEDERLSIGLLYFSTAELDAATTADFDKYLRSKGHSYEQYGLEQWFTATLHYLADGTAFVVISEDNLSYEPSMRPAELDAESMRIDENLRVYTEFFQPIMEEKVKNIITYL